MIHQIEWDEEKRAGNLRKHKVDFGAFRDFDWAAALTREDTRGQYGEARFVSIGPIAGRLHVAVWTLREGAVRLISLRKANKREANFYDSEI